MKSKQFLRAIGLFIIFTLITVLVFVAHTKAEAHLEGNVDNNDLTELELEYSVLEDEHEEEEEIVSATEIEDEVVTKDDVIEERDALEVDVEGNEAGDDALVKNDEEVHITIGEEKLIPERKVSSLETDSLTIEKTVAGEMANTTMPFQFWIVISGLNYDITKVFDEIPYEVIDVKNNVIRSGYYDPIYKDGIHEEWLEHGQRLVFLNIPRQVIGDDGDVLSLTLIYRIIESPYASQGYTTRAQWNGVDQSLERYDEEWERKFGIPKDSQGFYRVLYPGEKVNNFVEFVNEKQTVVPTSVRNLGTHWGLVGVAIAGIFGMAVMDRLKWRKLKNRRVETSELESTSTMDNE